MLNQQRICRRGELNGNCVSSGHLQESWLSGQDATPQVTALIGESCKCELPLLKKIISRDGNLRMNACTIPYRLLLLAGTPLNFLLSSMKFHRTLRMRNTSRGFRII